jgi:hypothetical protein
VLVSFLVQTKGADGAVEDHVVQHVEDAIAVARAFVGVARVVDLVSRRRWVYRNGQVLDGAAEVEALLEFDEP